MWSGCAGGHKTMFPGQGRVAFVLPLSESTAVELDTTSKSGSELSSSIGEACDSAFPWPFRWAHAITSGADDPTRRAVSLHARGPTMPPRSSSRGLTFAAKRARQTHRDWMARIATSSWLRHDWSTLRGGSWGRDSRLGKKGWMRQRQPPLGPADDSRREKSEVRVSCISVTLMHGCAESHRCQ
ncbi:hypothetical protein L1887_57283 [Cichorium endivia]|nr:hypothetical protein L1887_57283 [Cichorium endivia]